MGTRRPSKGPAKRSPAKTKPAPKKRAPSKKPGAKPSRAGSSRPRAVAVGKAPRTPPKGRTKRLLLLLLLVGALALTIDVALLGEAVEERMEGRPHDEPARIVGVVPRLAPGAIATPEGWRSVWSALGYTEVEDVDGPGEFKMVRGKWTVWPQGGDPLAVTVQNRHVLSLTRVDDGTRVAAQTFDPPAVGLLTDSSRERRSVVPLDDMPLALRRAVVSIEDERFYRHIGVDPRGIARAAVMNVRKGGVSQGGSTITQQLAKNMFLSADRTFSRKGQEALLALILEHRYDKDRLLEAYLNEIYLGQRNGYAVMGVGEAARIWFGKDVSALSVSECALLAGAIHSPNRTVPWKHPAEAKRRRDQVLNRMLELDAMPSAEIEAARVEPIKFADGSGLRRRAPWYVDSLISELGNRYSPEALHRDGLELVASVDARLQTAAEAAVRQHLADLKRDYPELWSDGRGPEVALVALDVRTGAVRALVGGADYGRSQFNRATSAKRQPGSAFKPIVLAAAIGDRWPKLKARSIVDDRPLSVAGAGPRGTTWSPKNYDGKFLGPITLRKATEQSRNIPFVQLGLDIGAGRIRSAAEAMGVTTPLAAVPSLAIGAQEVTPLDLAAAMATLAAGGQRSEPRFLEGVRDRDGRWLERAMPSTTAAIDPRVAAAVTDILEGVVDDGTARGVRRAGFKLPLAGKTGTSNDARDAWMVGYSRELAVAVWMGYDNDKALGLSSTSAAVPLFASFLLEAEPFLSGEAFGRPRAGAAPPHQLIREDRDRRRMEEEAMREMAD